MLDVNTERKLAEGHVDYLDDGFGYIGVGGCGGGEIGKNNCHLCQIARLSHLSMGRFETKLVHPRFNGGAVHLPSIASSFGQ